MAFDGVHEHPVDPERVAAARETALTKEASEEVARTLRLLADPVRARVASALVAGEEMCVGDIALAIDAGENTVSYALGQLRAGGLVRNHRAGRFIYYRLADPRLRDLVDLALRVGGG